MFGIFKSKSEVEKLMQKWHKLSTTNRSKSDEVYAEAEAIMNKIESLKNE